MAVEQLHWLRWRYCLSKIIVHMKVAMLTPVCIHASEPSASCRHWKCPARTELQWSSLLAPNVYITVARSLHYEKGAACASEICFLSKANCHLPAKIWWPFWGRSIIKNVIKMILNLIRYLSTHPFNSRGMKEESIIITMTLTNWLDFWFPWTKLCQQHALQQSNSICFVPLV